MSESPREPFPARRRERLLTAVLWTVLVAAGAAFLTGSAPAQSLQERLSETEEKLSDVENREGVLTTEISRASARIADLEGQVADLRNKEAEVAAALAQKQAELRDAQARLEVLRERLRRAITILEDRLVAIYKSGEPDLLTVVLDSNGYGDLVERTEYMRRLEEQDSSIVERVRGLRDETEQLVASVKAARDAIAAQKAELEATRAQLERRTAELASARAEQRDALASVRDQKQELEGDLSEISEQIEEQLGALDESTLPAGPIRGGSSGFIWPVNGPVTSGFGWRWGRMHEGIDIGVTSGTPIRAAKSGTIVLAAATGGYGNYTCISHGGGLSTCYAHQSSFARTSGSISQGSILGYVGCTGHCFGDHLHFEVRINGQAVDPLGYL
ncbi:MAG TPA: peptidoglycan DD-metalloendopeptidase family protein [Solirubrobacterales bacterium]|jgi:murein DD-endopeptidase MepM/ murein hydrolase activator NlpD|nr:peptidoglycan DD-metalloendopeptidase family protein [Solirubrobacterales bacterium]